MIIRVTAICIKDNRILLVREPVAGTDRSWSLPGGKVEEFETIHDGLIREIREETGLTILPKDLLYVSEKISEKKHIVHMTFLAEYLSGTAGEDQQLTPTEQIDAVEFIPISKLQDYGFSERFYNLVSNNFPNKGTYAGDKSNIGL